MLFTAFLLLFYPVDPFTYERTRHRTPFRNIKDWLLDPPTSQWYVFILNGVLSGILALQSYLSGRDGRRPEEVWPPGWLPAAIFIVVSVARTMLNPVDVGELEKLKYEYKGA